MVRASRARSRRLHGASAQIRLRFDPHAILAWPLRPGGAATSHRVPQCDGRIHEVADDGAVRMQTVAVRVASTPHSPHAPRDTAGPEALCDQQTRYRPRRAPLAPRNAKTRQVSG